MKKQILTVAAVAGLSVASLAGAAEINLYGASAQFDFLNANAVKFVQQYCAISAPTNPAGNGYVLQYKTAMGNTIKNGVVTGTNCGTGFGKPAIPGSGDTTLTLRYSGFGSGEGITTMSHAAPLDAEFATGCNIAAGQRRMPDSLSGSPSLADGNVANPAQAAINQAAYVAATTCKAVNIGTSDVAWDQFTQFATDEAISADGTNTYTVLPTFTQPAGTDNKTVAVPFAFYVNPGVKAYHCVDATRKTAGTIVHTGGYCTPAGLTGIAANTEQCDSNSTCEDLNAPTRIDNISRLQANILFAGQILNWNQLGGYFPSNPVKLCLRKPGSGTHVAFDETVMRAAAKAGWGADYTTFANNDLANLLPYTNFGGSSTDMKNCIGGTETDAAFSGVPATGAIGYLDADTADATAAPFFYQVKYNGMKPNRTNVRNGAYEFYTIGHMYAENTTLANAVVAYVQNPANVPSSKVKFWATANEMVFSRGLDAAYPAKGATPSAPQTP